MKKIMVASMNPVKINATGAGFRRMFPDDDFSVEGTAVESGVKEQPIGSDETYQGALNRLTSVQARSTDVDYWVAIEGGVEIHGDDIEVSAWIIIKSKDGRSGKAKSAMFVLPSEMAQHVRNGKEVGTATDIVFGQKNSKQGGGSIGVLTNDVITRTSYYEEAVICALVPFKNPELYPLSSTI
ncbi:inosine/xanthosine triphosphatase [soil metagenome]